MKKYAIEIIFKSHESFQSYQLTDPANSARKAYPDPTGRASQLVTLKGLVGFENDFNGIYFHHLFYFKTGIKSPLDSFVYCLTRKIYTDYHYGDYVV